MKVITYRFPRTLLDRIPWDDVMQHVWHAPWYLDNSYQTGYTGLRKILNRLRAADRGPVEVPLRARTVLAMLDVVLTAEVPGLSELYPKLVRPLITLYDEEVV